MESSSRGGLVDNPEDAPVDEKKKLEKEQRTTHLNGRTSSPSSASSSSPSHEFSFTISFHGSRSNPSEKAKEVPSIAIDLAPADDIFFHGHLLPLQLVSHPSISPRDSNTSLDDLSVKASDRQRISTGSPRSHQGIGSPARGRPKSKSFSLFRIPKWGKHHENCRVEEEKKKKEKFEVGRMLKRYAKAVKPLFFGGEKEKLRGSHRRTPRSFSGHLSSRTWGGKSREFSAPVSMVGSPTHSGPLLPPPAFSSSHDNSMEELQNAIQAAIAHCKQSIAPKEL